MKTKNSSNAPRNKTLGHVRYFTLYRIFPGERDYWVDQVPIVHELDFTLKNSRWRNDPQKCHDLLKKGETKWVDHNGVTHRLVIEDVQRPKKRC